MCSSSVASGISVILAFGVRSLFSKVAQGSAATVAWVIRSSNVRPHQAPVAFFAASSDDSCLWPSSGRPVLGERGELQLVCGGARVLVGQEEDGIGDPARVG